MRQSKCEKSFVESWWSHATLSSSLVVFGLLFALLLSDRLLTAAHFENHVLVVSDWTSVLCETAALSLVGILPVWLLGRRSRIFYAIFVPFGIVLLCVVWLVKIKFRTILSGSWVGIAFASSPEELRTFFGEYVSISIGVCLLALVVDIVCVVKFVGGVVRRTAVSRKSVAAALLGIVLLAGGACLMDKPIRKMLRGFPALWLLPSSVMQLSEQIDLIRMSTAPRIPDSICLSKPDGPPTVGVFVLGESATRTHWGLYGYARDTTPQMSSVRDELVVFKDLVTPSAATSEAMRHIFSTRTCEKCRDLRFVIPQALRQCQFSVMAYSNHHRWDLYSDEMCSLAGCESFVCIHELKELCRFDGEILPYLDEGLAAATNRTVVFLHLNGSHSRFEERCPSEVAPFGRTTSAGVERTQIDHYDNSIWYTDWVLGEVVKKLKAMGRPTWMIYLSDHGETPSAKSWRTATDMDLWEVPFIVWTSPEFNAEYPERVAALRRAKDKPLQSDQLFYGLLRFMGVEGLGNTPEEDFLSDSFKPRTPRLIFSGPSPSPYPRDL